MCKYIAPKRTISFFLLTAFIFSTLFTSFVAADPAVTINANDGYVKMFTTQGKPIWVKLSLPSGADRSTVAQGGSVSIRLDYVFDTDLKPVQGDSLQLYTSGFPNGTFLLPSNMHTSVNTYRNGVITLIFADAGGHDVLAHGEDGWMTVTFLVSGNEKTGTYNPQIIGNGSSENSLELKQIIIPEPGAPGPPGGTGNFYNIIEKRAENVLFPKGDGTYLMRNYEYQLPDVPEYIGYYVRLNVGEGDIWTKNHIKDFDYLVFTDTLSPGQEFVTPDDPWPLPITNPLKSKYEYAPFWCVEAANPAESPHGKFQQKAIDMSDGKVKVDISPDKKTITVRIEKGAKIKDGGGTVDEYTAISLYYYVRVIEPQTTEITKFSNKASVEYVKGGTTTGGDSSVSIDVIKQSGATFIIKEVGKWEGVLQDNGTAWDNYWGVENKGIHGTDNPLIVSGDDLLIYTINYKNTGDASKSVGEVQIADKLSDDLELIKLRDGDNMYNHQYDVNWFNFTYDEQAHEITLKNNIDFVVGKEYWASFIVRLKGTAETGKPIFNSAGTNTTVVKKDGYAIQILKCDAANKTIYLQGAEFTLYKYNENDGGYAPHKENGVAVVLATDGSGMTDVQNLPIGKYKLVETKFPDGYPETLSPVAVEFEVYPESSGFKGINKIQISNAPSNIPNLIDKDGVAVFTIPNDKASDPIGQIAVNKSINDADVGGNRFYVRLASDVGVLKFKTIDGKYVYDPDGSVTDIEISNKIGIILHDIPLSLGVITVTETADSRNGYSVAYTVAGETSTDCATITLTENNETAAVTVTNKKIPASEITITGQKNVEGINGANLAGYEFKLTEVYGNGEQRTDNIVDINGLTAASDASGIFTFEKLTDLKAGTYYFKIEELGKAPTGWLYAAPKILKVTVAKDSDENLTQTTEWLTENEELSDSVFINKYSATGSLTLTGTKKVNAGIIENNIFSFDVKEDGRTVAAGTNNGGEIVFGEIEYKLGDVGVHTYIISENMPPSGWTAETNPITIYVRVADNGDGTLMAEAYSDAECTTPVTAAAISFTNKKITVLEIKKTISYVGVSTNTDLNAYEISGNGNEIEEPATESVTEEPAEPLTEDPSEPAAEEEVELNEGSERIPLNGIFMQMPETFTFVLTDSPGNTVDLSRFDIISDRGLPVLTDGGINGQFKLVENETITIYGLDFAEYTLKEVDLGEHYYTEYPDNSIIFGMTDSMRIEFNNIEELPPPPMAEVTVIKDFVNPEDNHPNDGKKFRVRLISSFDDDYIFTLSEDKGWEDTKEVPPGIYLIEEDYADGYDNVSITLNGIAGNIISINDQDVITVVVTNKKIIPPEPISEDIWIEKQIIGIPAITGIPVFNFTLRELNTNTANDFKEGAEIIYPNEQINRAGRFFFTVSELTEGIYYYQINERGNASNSNWTYDTAPRIVTVTVDNSMSVSMGWSGGSPIFVNSYTPPYIPPVIPESNTPEPATPQPTTPEPEPTTVPEEADSDEPTTVPESTTAESITTTEPENGTEGSEQEESDTIPATTVPGDEEYLPPTSPEETITEPPLTEPATIMPTTAAPLVTVGDVEFYEDMPDSATPLANGWFAADLGDGLYEIFDENGTPLGFVQFDGDIEEWESFDDMIPLATFLWGDEENTSEEEIITLPTEPEIVTQAPKPTPQTGDGVNVIFAMLGLMILGAVTGIAVLRKKTGAE